MLCKAGVESTIFIIPMFFNKCGITLSILILFIVGILNFFSWNLMIKILEQFSSKTHTLFTIASKVSGPKFHSFVVAVTFMFNIGTNIAYNIVILEMF